MTIQTITHVLIAGSRYADSDMLTYAKRVVQRAHQLGWTILVGDNPHALSVQSYSPHIFMSVRLARLPNYGGKETTFIICTSDGQATAKLKHHVTHLDNGRCSSARHAPPVESTCSMWT